MSHHAMTRREPARVALELHVQAVPLSNKDAL